MYRSRKDRQHRKIISDYHTSKFNFKEIGRGGSGFDHLPKKYREGAEERNQIFFKDRGNIKKIFSRFGQEGNDDWCQRSRLRGIAKREPLQPYHGTEGMICGNVSLCEVYSIMWPDEWEFWLEESSLEDYLYAGGDDNYLEWLASDHPYLSFNNNLVLTQEHKDRYVEKMFGDLLEREVAIEENIQPLSISLISRIEDLKKAGDIAKSKREALTGDDETILSQ